MAGAYCWWVCSCSGYQGRACGSRCRRVKWGVSSALFLQVVTDLVTVIPVKSTNRGWANHVPVPTLGPDSVAMTEHIHTISRSRITKYGSCVDEESLDNMRMWIRDFLI
ncbi:type II toxin-antitoxin system PemK/MazF family toxin [Corynebacterium durum]|uniref:type II toxin-antitoxin system PemK/MazF family toxin n=1 Tax=Corynebacterium durum TaxID=61592 RepID=UPI00389AE351